MNTFAIKIGKQIKEYRKKLNFSREYLSEQADISTKYLGEIERGTVNVSAIILYKISKTFGISLSELLNFEHQKSIGEIKAELFSLIEQANEKDIITIYRLVVSLLK